MSIRVTLSYEEKIINARMRIHHKRTDDVITRHKREFDAMREILQPLYSQLAERDAEIVKLRAMVDRAEAALDAIQLTKICGSIHDSWQTHEDCPGCISKDTLADLRDEPKTKKGT